MIRGYLFIYMFLLLFLGVASLIHGAMFTYPVVWVFNGRDYQVGVSVVGAITPIIICIVLGIVLLVREGMQGLVWRRRVLRIRSSRLCSLLSRTI